MTATGPLARLAQDLTRSKKRKRAEETPSQKQRKGPKVVGVNALPWNEVSLPDNLDDAEGFFGLEEISDVEIAKDERSGRVEYRVGEGIPYTAPHNGPLLTMLASETLRCRITK